MSGSDFAHLSRRVTGAGLMERRPGYYTAKITFTVALFLASWALFVWVGDSWYQLLVAVLLAFASTQVAFLGHDIGHRQVFLTRRPSEIAGLLLGNLSLGLSYGWWMDKHTRHHANPNHIENDPDVGAGAIVWTEEQARDTTGFGTWMAQRQAYLFFPLLLLEGLHLNVASVRALRGNLLRRRRDEAVLMLVHTAAYLGLIFAVLPWPKAILFIVVHKALWGLYLGCSFAPNHKGMPTMGPEDSLDFLRRQVLTSRNVRGGRVVDFALGALNYQIEHHLFPSMPRPHLRKAQPHVRAYCAELGIPYEEAGVVDSYRQALQHLHDVGAPLRNPDPVPV